MSEQSGKYLIKVQSEYDGSGAAAAAQDLKHVGQEAKTAGEHIEGGKKSLREMGEVARLGGVGAGAELFKFLRSPEFLIPAAAFEALNMYREGQEKIHENNVQLLKDSREYAEELRGAHAKALADTTAAFEDWNRHLEHLHDNVDILTKKMDVLNAAGKLQNEVAQTQRAAADSVAEARVKQQEATGAITSPQATAQIEAIKLKELQDKNAREEKEMQDERDRATVRSIEAAEASKKKGEDVQAGIAQREPMLQEKGFGEDELKRRQKVADKAADALDEAQATWHQKSGDLSAEEQAAVLAGGDIPGRFSAAQGTGISDAARKFNAAKGASETDQAAVRTQIKINAGYEEKLAELNAQIESDKKLHASSDALATAQQEKADEINASLVGKRKENRATEAGQAETDRINATTDTINRNVSAFGNTWATGPGGNAPGAPPDWNAGRDIAAGHAMLQDISMGRAVPAQLVQNLLAAIAQLHGETKENQAALEQIASQLAAGASH